MYGGRSTAQRKAKVMRAILYCSGDAPMISAIHELFGHVAVCPDCQRNVQASPEARSNVAEMFTALNAMVSDDIPMFDYVSAFGFCDYWLQQHELMSQIDMLIATPVGNG